MLTYEPINICHVTSLVGRLQVKNSHMFEILTPLFAYSLSKIYGSLTTNNVHNSHTRCKAIFQ